MFRDKSINAIFCAMGGFNCNAVFDYLDFELIKNNPKIICGYSDPTSILNVIYAKTGLITFHGPNFKSLSDEEVEYDRADKGGHHSAYPSVPVVSAGTELLSRIELPRGEDHRILNKSQM